MFIYAQESPGRIHKWKLRMVVSGGDNERFWYFCFPFYTFLYSLKFLQEAIFTIFLAKKRFLPKNQFIIKNFPSQRLLLCFSVCNLWVHFPWHTKRKFFSIVLTIIETYVPPYLYPFNTLNTHTHTQSCYAPSQFRGRCFPYSSAPRHSLKLCSKQPGVAR